MRKQKLYTSIGKDKLKRRKKRKKYVKNVEKNYTSIGKDKLKRRKNRKKDVKNA